jgi:hypothetical protein
VNASAAARDQTDSTVDMTDGKHQAGGCEHCRQSGAGEQHGDYQGGGPKCCSNHRAGRQIEQWSPICRPGRRDLA